MTKSKNKIAADTTSEALKQYRQRYDGSFDSHMKLIDELFQAAGMPDPDRPRNTRH